MTRNHKIIIASLIVLATGTAIAITRVRKKKQVNDILRVINEGIGESGDLTDLLGGINASDIKKIKTDSNATARASKAATKIMLAKGGNFGDDDEDAVFDALRSLSSQAEVKLVSNIIYANKGKTLDTWLSFLDSSEKATANGIINKLK